MITMRNTCIQIHQKFLIIAEYPLTFKCINIFYNNFPYCIHGSESQSTGYAPLPIPENPLLIAALSNPEYNSIALSTSSVPQRQTKRKTPSLPFIDSDALVTSLNMSTAVTAQFDKNRVRKITVPIDVCPLIYVCDVT